MTTLHWGVGQWGVNTWGFDNTGLALGGHRFRLTVRWYDREDLFPTYYTWLQREESYNTTLANYASYQDLLDNIGGGIELNVDLTCDVAGITTRAGRSSITEHVRATEMNFTLVDRDGTHDPRVTPIVARSRIGARLQLEVMPEDGVWTPVATTWVDSWRKQLDPASDPQVDVTSADALKMLAQARPGELDEQGDGERCDARVERVLEQVPWNDKWGAPTVRPMANTMNAMQWDGTTAALDHLRDCLTVEDGLLWVDGSGGIQFEAEGWRSTRSYVLGVDLIPNDTVAGWSEPPDDVVCPTELSADDNDLDIINAMTVWRSTVFDPLVGNPPEQPDVQKKYASDSDSISHYGEHREVLAELPAKTNTRTQQLADLWVARYKDGAQDIGEASFDLVTRPQDAPAILGLKWGDKVLVRDRVGGTLLESVHEVIGVEHAITPYRWEATIVLDRKVS